MEHALQAVGQAYGFFAGCDHSSVLDQGALLFSIYKKLYSVCLGADAIALWAAVWLINLQTKPDSPWRLLSAAL
jgi:hypothetical protein